ncbi:uncharacterized protein KQ657_001795 [Scheffersomyces spartinae]|uniref:NAD-dependent epimerase/dehydratase domain-containing protein n=1 Tax=Scheffersomyces spartinae TaxID=45513 RepID=A0A9P7V7M3_9ASCO|nr:uncharacterized protein KQ657_001795 [Scheffersomyces spartinae]KAG7192396.1 hypothetical protein KQ657_001795 [Scheffersomyces spartinae]
MPETVFITGVSGYIALNVALQLSEKGYHIVGTVRTKDKGEYLVRQLGADKFSYEIVTDLDKENCFDEALAAHPEVTVVLHIASPCFFTTTDAERDILKPAIEGTKNILSGILRKAPQVRRVVHTSSDSAIMSFKEEHVPTKTFDETTWNENTYEDSLVSPFEAYYGSKALGEKYAWKFVKENPVNFTLATICPSYVFGPQPFDEPFGGKSFVNASNEEILGLLSLKSEEEFEDLTGGYIYCRDIARAHIEAFERDDLVGKRLLVTNGSFGSQYILDLIHKMFPQLASSVIKGPNPGQGKEVMASKLAKVDNSRTRKLLTWGFKDLEDIVKETVQQFLNNTQSS